jgi:hypothetical protein
VLVPKLRAGWAIAAFEVTLRYGLLVHLRRYLHDGFARAFGYRVDGSQAAALRAAGAPIEGSVSATSRQRSTSPDGGLCGRRGAARGLRARSPCSAWAFAAGRRRRA